MKKIVLSLAAMLTALTLSAGSITKNYDNLKKFNAIQISDFFDATIVQSDEYSATVTIDTRYEEYLDVSVVGKMLYVRIKDHDPRVNLRNIARNSMKVTITAPELSQICLTGAASLTSPDLWVSPMERFTLVVSGAAKASNLRIEGVELAADVSGASSVGIEGDFNSVDIEISGSSALMLAGNYEDIEVEASGTSKVSISGNVENIESECNGSSFLDAVELKAEKAEIKCSGASKATIDVSRKLEVDLSGASSCHYRSSNNSLVVDPDVSRASSLKRIK